jgi:GH15 family glucan-1,4-alpha-glucosidase
LSLRNHVGLLAEEYDPVAGRQIGNFPQAFSHLALILTAYVIEYHGRTTSLAVPFTAQVRGAAA